MRRPLTFSFIALSLLIGCGDDSPSGTGGSGGTSSGTATGEGGTSSGTATGEGGTSAGTATGMGGMGGTGGMGEGGMGEGGGQASWSDACLSACQKLDLQCGMGMVCTNLGISCANTPPAEPLECITRCIGEMDTTCSDISDWLDANAAPAVPSQFIQCLAACPGPPDGTAPINGMAACMGAGCQTEFDACTQDTDCQAWIDCAVGQPCSGPSCYADCKAQNAPNNAPLDALLTCSCNLQPGTVASSWVGTGDCVDIVEGHLDACGLASQ